MSTLTHLWSVSYAKEIHHPNHQNLNPEAEPNNPVDERESASPVSASATRKDRTSDGIPRKKMKGDDRPSHRRRHE